MRLADFILAHIEPILAEWETFARDIWPAPTTSGGGGGGGGTSGGGGADPAELRDHAEAILRATVDDMRSQQSAGERSTKSHGHGGASTHSRALNHASVQHGAGRVDSGFKLAEVIAEYRALRASVIRLWRESHPNPHATDVEDLTRFNESIDQSLARAVESYSDRVDRSRRLFLAILGHDLRTPLAAIKITATVLDRRAAKATASPADISEWAGRITTSAHGMDRMIRDLLDFTAAGLGRGLPVAPVPTDLHPICLGLAEEARAAHPDYSIDYAADGDAAGRWDPARLRQAIGNLLANAVQHGPHHCDAGCTVTVRLTGHPGGVTLTVHNTGKAIPAAAMPTLFDPLRRVADLAPDSEHTVEPPAGAGSRAGLGLFIAHQIVTAHGGTIHAASSADAGTTFTIRLPRG